MSLETIVKNGLGFILAIASIVFIAWVFVFMTKHDDETSLLVGPHGFECREEPCGNM